MIPENNGLASMYLTIPLSDFDACVRIAEIFSLNKHDDKTKEEQKTAANLFGMRFASFTQLISAINQLGLTTSHKYLMRSKWATTIQLIVSKQNTNFKLIVHGYGFNEIHDSVQIINCSENEPDFEEERN